MNNVLKISYHTIQSTSIIPHSSNNLQSFSNETSNLITSWAEKSIETLTMFIISKRWGRKVS